MTTEEIQKDLELHKKWLKNEEGGTRLDWSGKDLYDADLRYANLYSANLRNANLYSADLRNADLRNADLRNADLRNADLRDADLRGADLRGANLDYSCFPLWCGGTNFKASPELIYQLCYHICTLDVGEETAEFRSKFKDLANMAPQIERYGLKKIE